MNKYGNTFSVQNKPLQQKVAGSLRVLKDAKGFVKKTQDQVIETKILDDLKNKKLSPENDDELVEYVLEKIGQIGHKENPFHEDIFKIFNKHRPSRQMNYSSASPSNSNTQDHTKFHAQLDDELNIELEKNHSLDDQ